MSELSLQVIQILKLMSVVGFASLYGFGGISGKYKRRILGAVVLTASYIGFSLWMGYFNAWAFLCLPLHYGALSLGYGAEETKDKIIRRSVFGLANGFASIPLAISTGSWTVFGLHIILCVVVSTVLGVFNPTKSARAEETIIGFTIGFLPVMGMI